MANFVIDPHSMKQSTQTTTTVEDNFSAKSFTIDPVENGSSRKPWNFFARWKKKAQTSAPVGRRKMPWKRIGIVLAVLFVILAIPSVALGAVGFHTYQVGMNLKQKADELQVSGRGVIDQLKTQNLPGAESSLIEVESKLEEFKTEYAKLAYYGKLPIASKYYQDGQHGIAAGEAAIRAGKKSLAAIVPYADVLGFQGEGTFAGGTAEDRIRLLLETLSKVSPEIDEITTELETLNSELAQINPNDYPEQFRGMAIRAQIEQARSLSEGAVASVTEFRPVLEVLPQIAGSEERKKYLVIFQNDNELRPTGGFMTAYAVMFIENGKVTPEKSDDIYELDKKFRKNIPIPEILGKYLTTERRFNLRDMNISPDFKVSMDTFYEQYRAVPGEPSDIDGIITVDSEMLSELVRILGPVDVPGYGVFSAETDPRCDCPQIIYALSEIITRPTPYIREDRKGIIAPMMQAILQKAYSAPKELWPQLMQLAWGQIEEKHVQFYFFDEKAQQAAETVNAAGRMKPYTQGNDYFAVVDANLGGAKSNLFVNSEVEQEVSAPENGRVKKKVTLVYNNPRRGDNCNLEAGLLCLNGVLYNWSRIYLPPGSEIISVNGYTSEYKTSEDLGLMVVEGSFRLNPQSSSRVVLEYTIPYEDTQTYRVDVRKQGGTGNWPYFFDVNGTEEKIELKKDQTLSIPF